MIKRKLSLFATLRTCLEVDVVLPIFNLCCLFENEAEEVSSRKRIIVGDRKFYRRSQKKVDNGLAEIRDFLLASYSFYNYSNKRSCTW